MKVIPSLLTLCTLLAVGWSCKNSSVPKQSKQADKAQLQENYTLFSQPVTFSGTIGKYPLFMKFNYCGYAWLVGFNIAQTNKRNISGLYTKSHDTFFIKLKEPGSQEDDGSFDLFMIEDDTLLQGKWTSADNKTELPVKMSMSNFKVQHNTANSPNKGAWARCDTGNLFYEDSLINFNKELLTFTEDGLCRFAFYKDLRNDKEQQKIQYGYWFFEKNNLKIIWLKDLYFHSNTTLFKFTRGSNERNNALECKKPLLRFCGPVFAGG